MVNINEPNLSAAMSGGASPKGVYLLHLLNLEREFFHVMCSPQVCSHCGNSNNSNIEAAIATLIAFTPDELKQKQLWALYTKLIRGELEGQEQIGGNTITTASVLTMGQLTIYLSDVLEFTEKSTGGFL
jgi:hypothetical protein